MADPREFAHIIPFTSPHIDAAVALWERTPGVGLSEADHPDELAGFLLVNAAHCFAAVASDEVVGTVLCGCDGRRGYIYHLAVATEFRGSGLGRQLVRRVLESLRERGIRRCHAMVYAENESGRRFWARVGWRHRVDLVIHSRDT